MASWRRIEWSDECMMLLRVTDGSVRLWKQDKNPFVPKHAQATLRGGG